LKRVETGDEAEKERLGMQRMGCKEKGKMREDEESVRWV
jgi:hypothetical protein